MKPKLPAGTMAEKVRFARSLYQEQQAGRSKVRLARRTRRVIVVVLFLVVAATVALLIGIAANLISGGTAEGALYFMLALLACFFLVLLHSVGGLNVGNPYLDERERALRDHAWALAYRILVVVVGIGIFAVLFATDVFHWIPSPRADVRLTDYLLPFVWFMGTLPMALLAWTLPDPDPDPEPRPNPGAGA